MSEQKYYYKVCRIENDVICSWNNPRGATHSIDYKLNEYVYPKIPGTYLMIFDSLENAKEMIRNNGGTGFIFECEVEGICQNPSQFRLNCNPPVGTCYAYGVKLTKEVVEWQPKIYYFVNWTRKYRQIHTEIGENKLTFGEIVDGKIKDIGMVNGGFELNKWCKSKSGDDWFVSTNKELVDKLVELSRLSVDVKVDSSPDGKLVVGDEYIYEGEEETRIVAKRGDDFILVDNSGVQRAFLGSQVKWINNNTFQLTPNCTYTRKVKGN